MENPIRAARRSLNLTQRSLAEQAGISPTAVLRYEQGLYEEISDKIYRTLLEYEPLDVSIVDLPAYYRAWRTHHQYEASKYFNPLPALAVLSDEHPFVTFRRSITTRAVGKDSRISFCILLAIHPSVVLDYEAGKQEHMPNLIQQALANAGVSARYINSLDQLGGVYYDRRVTSSGR
jgi:transcriptional regulator with XRE-family HTH domain